MKYLFFAAGLGLCAASGVSAATIVNGSFEDSGVQTGGFDTFSTGSTGITGWTVGSGSVDLVNQILWVAEDGQQAVDLDGNNPGSIFQDVTDLIIGAEYRVSFYLSGNEAGNPTIKTLNVSAAGTIGLYSFDDSNGGAAADVWELNTFDFVAGQTTERLLFASTTGGTAFGPALDSVSIELLAAVPLPAGGLLLIGGLAGLGALRRKRAQA